jgi:hypothetical protein
MQITAQDQIEPSEKNLVSNTTAINQSQGDLENERFLETTAKGIKKLAVDRLDQVEKKQKNDSRVKPPDISSKRSKYQDADGTIDALTVNSERYEDLFHQWRKSGAVKAEGERPPLRVQNLEKVYDLFQMKPVAIVNKSRFIDLRDGSRILEETLKVYSQTVFRVDRPWQKWGDALKSARVRRSDNVEIRYYMYGFIENAIYDRASRALNWCRKTGILEKNDSANTVDVMGRAYVINKEGGGRFGVFVPVSVDIYPGRSIHIDIAECFSSEPDVQALRSAGII